MTPSPAFVSEVQHQGALARRELAAASDRGDEAAAECAADRLADLAELTHRTTGVEMSAAALPG